MHRVYLSARQLALCTILIFLSAACRLGPPASPTPDAELHYLRGLYALDQQDVDVAIEAFTLAIRLDPDYADAYCERGYAYAEKQEYDRAIADYDRAIELNARYALAFVRRGIAYYDMGDYSRALADYDRAIEIAPQRAGSYVTRGAYYGARGDHEKARADLHKALELGLEPEAERQVRAFLQNLDATIIPSDTAGILKGKILTADGASFVDHDGGETGLVALYCPNPNQNAECLRADDNELKLVDLIPSICQADDPSDACVLRWRKSAAAIQADGSYTFVDVPPGQYDLILVVLSSGIALEMHLINVPSVRAGEVTVYNYVAQGSDSSSEVLGAQSVLSLALDPTTPSTPYAGTQNGVFKSEDGGTTWRAISVGLSGRTIEALAIDPLTPTTLYAGTDAGVYVSADGGEFWSALHPDLARTSVRVLALDPLAPSTLYAGGFGSGVFAIRLSGAVD